MVQGTAPVYSLAPLPPGFDPPIIALLSLPQPIDRRKGAQGPKTSSLSQSKVPVRDGQGLIPITEEQASDSDQPENSMGGGTGCSIIRRRKRRDQHGGVHGALEEPLMSANGPVWGRVRSRLRAFPEHLAACGAEDTENLNHMLVCSGCCDTLTDHMGQASQY
ncbi:hypothetical protein STEG23_033988 [Scotinomys teguina]